MSQVLVLNASYEYLNVTSLKRAVKLVYKGKAEVVEAVGDRQLKARTLRIPLPSIIRMLYFIHRPFKEVPLTRKNILLRDRHVCQYCGKQGDTVDHVIPRSRGGRDSWENCVCACAFCNRRKNNRTPDEANMDLLRKPRKPSHIPWLLIKQDASREGWARFLFWNISIEEAPA
jgi:5-methylcytosine-specific restriction endonuclease McrA